MQTSFSGKQGILPELSRTIHLESGIVGKSGLSPADDSADFSDDFILDVFIYGLFYKISLRNDELGMMNDE
jgi:hypothetical protein